MKRTFNPSNLHRAGPMVFGPAWPPRAAAACWHAAARRAASVSVPDARRRAV